MNNVDQILELSERIFKLKARREEAANTLEEADSELAAAIGELAKYHLAPAKSANGREERTDEGKQLGSRPGGLGYRMIALIRASSHPLSGKEMAGKLSAGRSQRVIPLLPGACLQRSWRR